MKKSLLIIFYFLCITNLFAHSLKGTIINTSGEPLIGASIRISNTNYGAITDVDGNFNLYKAPRKFTYIASYIGYETQDVTISLDTLSQPLYIILQENTHTLEDIEVFGLVTKQPEKMDMITRLPLRTNEQIQTISVVSEMMIEQQGTSNLADATRNVVGMSTYATYGNASESLSTRGFRGIPVLKNGVRVHSDFRGQGTLTEMQGVESIQIIKGSAAVTQGIGNDIGSAGGVVNIATKTPKFINNNQLSLRSGSFGQIRPTFDLQRSYANNKLGLRLNGAIERTDNFRKYVDKNRFYINPSLAWNIDKKSTLIVEMDYLYDSRTPDRGTVNLAADSINALYTLPNNNFLGFKSDRVFTNQLNYSARFLHQISEHYSLRVAATGSQLNTDNMGASNVALKNVASTGDYHLRQRSLGRSQRDDSNQSVQIDFIGKDVFTWKIKHTFQLGADFKRTRATTQAFKSAVIDTINVLEQVSNVLPSTISLSKGDETTTYSYQYGVLAQDVITFNKYIKAVLGLRYSFGNNYDNLNATSTSGDALNPLVGLIISPIEQVNIFGSYTNTTDLRSAANLMEDGTQIGASTTEQFEVGIKSEWFNQRLRANVTLFSLNNYNLSYQVYDEYFQATPYYDRAGTLKRNGVEVEVTGRILPNLHVVLGYAYLKAQYTNSPAYVDSSAPMNTPQHTANGWIHYTLDRTPLKGLSIGLGAYYVGERPINDFTQKYTHGNTQVGVKPFNLDDFTTINASIGYNYKRASLNLVFNNITNALGYNSYYRGGYVNPIDPFNFSAQISYKF